MLGTYSYTREVSTSREVEHWRGEVPDDASQSRSNSAPSSSSHFFDERQPRLVTSRCIASSRTGIGALLMFEEVYRAPQLAVFNREC